MPKFNETKKPVQPDTQNLAGGVAYSIDPKFELASIALTSFLKNQFYRKADDTLTRVEQLYSMVNDPLFVAKLAVYARDKYHMRSITHALAGIIAGETRGIPIAWKRQFFHDIAMRPDDMAEILAYYYAKYGGRDAPEPNALKKGFGDRLSKLDEYRCVKYRMETRNLKLVDLVNVCHPKGTEALTKLINGQLRSDGNFGSQLAEKSAKDWGAMLSENKVGYMALLRNLRHILNTKDAAVIDMAAEQLVDGERVKKSKVLPFRFLTAYSVVMGEKVKGQRKIANAIEAAATIAVDNVPEFGGRTCVVLDGSGSMGQLMSKESIHTWTSRAENWTKSIAGMGALLAAVLYKSNEADFIMFDSDARYVPIPAGNSVLGIAHSMMTQFRGGATNFSAPFVKMGKTEYDRIFLLSDMQGWVEDIFPGEYLGGTRNARQSYYDYKATSGASPRLYSFDLAGYGTAKFPEKDVWCLAGFSEQTFEVIAKMESNKDALLDEIDAVELG